MIIINNCPFCKSDKTKLHDAIIQDGETAEGYVFCESCGAQGPLVSNLTIGNVGFNIPSGEAIEKLIIGFWNAATIDEAPNKTGEI